jgi:hypothetical protein
LFLRLNRARRAAQCGVDLRHTRLRDLQVVQCGLNALKLRDDGCVMRIAGGVVILKIAELGCLDRLLSLTEASLSKQGHKEAQKTRNQKTKFALLCFFVGGSFFCAFLWLNIAAYFFFSVF